MSSSNWIEQAIKYPVSFAQVREDASIDLELARSFPSARILMIASGGCTA